MEMARSGVADHCEGPGSGKLRMIPPVKDSYSFTPRVFASIDSFPTPQLMGFGGFRGIFLS